MLKKILLIVAILILNLQATPLINTGQTQSYDGVGNIVTDGSIKDDRYYQSGATRSYSRSEDVVTDNVTGLEWQDNEYKYLNWDDASSYCSSLPLDSGGWRLPSIKELETLKDYGQENLSLTVGVFQNNPIDFETLMHFWSSTMDISNTSNAWTVYFGSGYTSTEEKTTNYYVRCVRGEHLSTSNFFRDDVTEIVTDITTGLQWQDDSTVKTARRTWTQAIDYCESLDNYDGWRLPNINELRSISDYSQFDPSIDTTVFLNTYGFYYFSSTSRMAFPDSAWSVVFHDGQTNIISKTQELWVRCVRELQPSFTFNSPQLFNKSSLSVSEEVIIDNINDQTPISIAFDKNLAEFEINQSGNWITSGHINEGDTLIVRTLTPDSAVDFVNVTVTVGSYSTSFGVGAYLDALDIDDDNILDAWEELGYVPIDTTGDGKFNTKWDFDNALYGTQKPKVGRKDLYLWIDELENLEYPLKDEATEKMIKAFLNGGISLHVTKPNKIPTILTFTFPSLDSTDRDNQLSTIMCSGSTSLVDSKNNYFSNVEALTNARNSIYHYMLYGHKYYAPNKNGDCVLSESSGWAPGRKNLNEDFIFVGSYFLKNELKQSGTLMHEFGHALGLGHGGPQMVNGTVITPIEEDDYHPDRHLKPHYLSIMNYLYQFGLNNGEDIDFNSCIPINQVLDENHLNEEENFLQTLSCKENAPRITKVSVPSGKTDIVVWDDIDIDDDEVNWNNIGLTWSNEDLDFNINGGDLEVRAKEYNTTKLTVYSDWDNIDFSYYKGRSLDFGLINTSGIEARSLRAVSISSDYIEEPNFPPVYESSFHIDSIYHTQSTQNNKTIQYSFTVHNDGVIEDTYDITYLSDNGWAMFNIPSQVTLEAGEKYLVIFDVIVPNGLSDGFFDKEHIYVVSQNTTVKDSHDFETTIVSSAKTDSDSDGIPDDIEIAQGTDPYSDDSDGDGISDKFDRNPLIIEDEIPDTLNVNDFIDIDLGTYIETNTYTLTGFNVGIDIYTKNAEISIDGADYITHRATILPDQNVKFRVKSSNHFNDVVNAKVFIGTQSLEFTVKTVEEPEKEKMVNITPIIMYLLSDSAPLEPFANATLLYSKSSIFGVIEYGQTYYYKIIITSEKVVEFYTTGNTDTYGILYDEKGDIIRHDDDINEDNLNFHLSHSLKKGTYYLSVSGFGDVTSGEHMLIYENWNLVPLIEDIPLDKTIFQGKLDYYKIDLEYDLTLNLYTTGDTDTYGDLYDSDMNLIMSNDDTSNTDFNFKIELNATQGIYYLKVRGYNEMTEGNYTIYNFNKI